jgi:hypothetical protein
VDVAAAQAAGDAQGLIDGLARMSIRLSISRILIAAEALARIYGTAPEEAVEAERAAERERRRSRFAVVEQGEGGPDPEATG